ncbi:MAG: ATP-binding cassette domain-containing protein, partial [Antricoccus sp.]
DELDHREERLARRIARRAGIAQAAAILTMSGATAGIWVLAATTKGLAPENAALIILLPLGLLELAALIPAGLTQLGRSRISAERIFDVLDTPEPPPALDGPMAPMARSLTARNIAVTWPGGELPAVAGISFELRPGRRIALVGPTGSGKSTVLAALLGFAQVSSGAIFIDGVPAAGHVLRESVAWCDQQAHLFDTSIAENVRLARPAATDDEVAEALRAAQLGSWLQTLPRGMRTRVGQSGILVSGGERQRIAVARMILADRPVLLIDEPTAGLDDQTAAGLMCDIERLANAGKAILLVTHDLDQVRDFDEIINVSGQSSELLIHSGLAVLHCNNPGAGRSLIRGDLAVPRVHLSATAHAEMGEH